MTTTTTIIDGSGVGAGGITRVLTELCRYWPAGHRIQLVGAPRGWQVPTDSAADVEIVLHQYASRSRTIASATAALLRATSRFQAGQVLSMSPSAAVLGSRLPVTTIVHDLAFRLWPLGLSRVTRAYRRVSYAAAIRRSAALVCVSARTRHDLLGLYGVPVHRSRIWVPGSDLATSLGAVPPALAGAHRPYLLITGHAPHKGVELAVAALGMLPTYLLAVLTGGVRSDRYGAVAAEHGVADRLVLLDRLSDADYAATVTGATAFLMPSHFEGYGLPAVEALRLGTPAVISPDPALHEATGGRAVRMVSWTAEALAQAVYEVGRAGTATPSVTGRTWSEATGELFDLLYSPERPRSPEGADHQ